MISIERIVLAIASIAYLLVGCQRVENKLYLSSQRGKDSNDGSVNAPLRTLTAARDRIGTLNDLNEKDTLKVFLEEGSYILNETFLLNQQNIPQSDPVSFQSLPGQAVTITGGFLMDVNQFEKIDDESIRERLRPEARDRVLRYDLKGAGITEFGNYHPNPPHGTNPKLPAPPLEVFFNGKSLPIARWPNDSTVRIDRVVDRGAISKRDGYAQVLDTTRRGGAIGYSYDRAANWQQAEGIWLSGYFHWGWFHDILPVDRIDPANKVMHLAAPHMYGIRGSYEDPEWRKGEGFRTVRKYYAFNLLEEIDQPGEWYLDRASGTLYIWPPSGFEEGEIAVSVLDQPLVSLDSVQNITFKNISFAYGKASGITIQGGSSNHIVQCDFRNFGNLGIEVSGQDHQIVGCRITQTGQGGINAKGGNRRTLEPGNILIKNCEIDHYSVASNRAIGIDLEGVGQKVMHNYIHHSDTRAIGLNGNDHLIAYNIIDSVHMQGDDVGATGLGRNPSEQGTVIKHNIFSHIGSEPNNVTSIYLDDGTSGMTITGNIFYKASTGTYGCIFMNGGSDNHITDNIFIDSKLAANLSDCFHTWAAKRIVQWTQPDSGLWTVRLKQEVDITSPVWRETYPNLATFLESDPATPQRNIFDKNVMINTETFIITATPEDNPLLASNFLTGNNYTIESQADWIRDGSLKFDVLKELPLDEHVLDFKAIPIDSIGILE